MKASGLGFFYSVDLGIIWFPELRLRNGKNSDAPIEGGKMSV